MEFHWGATVRGYSTEGYFPGPAGLPGQRVALDLQDNAETTDDASGLQLWIYAFCALWGRDFPLPNLIQQAGKHKLLKRYVFSYLEPGLWV